MSFQDKLCLKLFLANNRFKLTNGLISLSNVELYLVSLNRMTIKSVINNQELYQILLENIKKSKDNHELYTNVYQFIAILKNNAEEFGLLPEFNERFNNMLKEYCLSNPLDIPFIASAFMYKSNINDIIDDTFQEIIPNIGEATIDSIFASFLDQKYNFDSPEVSGINLICKVIDILKKSNPDRAAYAINKLKTIMDNHIANIHFDSMEEEREQKILELISKSNDSVFRQYQKDIIKGEDFARAISWLYIYNSYKLALSYSRCSNDYLTGLTMEQMLNINIKNSREVIEAGLKKYGENLNNSHINYMQDTFLHMYIILGKKKALDIINGVYGEVSFQVLEAMFYNVEIFKYNIPQKNGETKYTEVQQALLNFLFSNKSTENNINIRKIFEDLNKYFALLPLLINKWELYYDLFNGNMSLSEIINVIEMANLKETTITPDIENLTPIIKRTGNNPTVIFTYREMLKRTTSSIPKVQGEYGDYTYEVLDLHDLNQMTVGYDTHCCFTFDGASESSLINACTSKDGRVFAIKKNGKIVAQSWVWRNGNVVCFDNIEVEGVIKRLDAKIFAIYQKVAQEMIEISKQTEPDQAIELVSVGTGYSDVILQGEKLSQDETLLPAPTLYTDASNQILLAKSQSYTKPNAYDAKPNYQDMRKKPIYIDTKRSLISFETISSHIDAIRFALATTKQPQEFNINDYSYVVLGEDWYIAISKDGKIEKQINSYDARAEAEMQECLDSLKNNKLTQ